MSLFDFVFGVIVSVSGKKKNCTETTQCHQRKTKGGFVDRFLPIMGCGRYSVSVSEFLIFCPQLNLQERLKVAEEQLVSRNEAESDLESLDDLKAELGRREKALRATEEERDTLMSELEELDRQNQEATQVCVTLVLYLFVYCLFQHLI